MKIERTSGKLIIQNRPIKVWLFSSCFLIFGIILCAATFETTTLACRRINAEPNICTFQHWSLLEKKISNFPTNELQAARIETYRQGFRTYNQLVLITKRERLSFTSIGNKFDVGRKEEIAKQINQFISNTQQESLKFKNYPGIEFILFYLIWAIFSCWFLYIFCRTTTSTFDKSTQAIKVQKRTFLGTKSVDFTFPEIANVIVSNLSIRSGGKETLLLSGVEIQPLSRKAEGVYIDFAFKKSQREANNIANLIREFLNLKYTSSLEKLLEAGKWREADEETARVICQIMNREKEGWLTHNNWQDFPQYYLRIIDRLWLKYSNKKFGFSVQKQIWLKSGGKLDKKYDSATFRQLGDKVGWRKGTSWLDHSNLTFSINAPTGHLPSIWWFCGGLRTGIIGWTILGRERGRAYSCLFSKI